MSNYPRKIAVVTGDLVRSTKLSANELEKAMSAITSFTSQQQHWIGENFTRQSGDGWQMIVPLPQQALRSALAVRAKLRSFGANFDTYLSIAVGELTSAPPTDLNQTNNELFVNSGREMNILKERAAKDGILLAHWDMDTAASTGFLADYISQNWTPAQAEAMTLFLNPYSDELTYTEAAERLGKTRQAVTKALKAAGKDSVLKALFFLEASLADQFASNSND